MARRGRRPSAAWLSAVGISGPRFGRDGEARARLTSIRTAGAAAGDRQRVATRAARLVRVERPVCQRRVPTRHRWRGRLYGSAARRTGGYRRDQLSALAVALAPL